jgi:hypothetical protein
MFNERLTKLTTSETKTPPFFYYSSFFKRYSLLVFFCFLSFFLAAQKGLSIESTFHFGAVTKHSPELTFAVKGPTIGADINFKFQTFGKKDWQQWRNFPHFGISAAWFRFGNNSILGNAFTICPNITTTIFKGKKWKGHFQVGTGIAYLTKKYNPVSNPENNAIGSSITASMLMKFYVARQINSNLKFHAGLSLNHFSNGGSRLPNYGLNVPALMLSLNYSPEPLQKSDFTFHQKNKKAIRRFGLEVHSGAGLVQRFSIGGPRYPIYFVALGANYYLNQVNRIIAGFEYEQNKAIFEFVLHTNHSETESDAKKKASRLTFFVGDEFLFGNWSMTLSVGVYLGDFSFLRSGAFSNKFSTRYYFPSKGILNRKIFLSFSLKTHLTVAEYFGLGGGVNF